MNNFNKTLAEVKEANEDFEFYPTDPKMLDVICKEIIKEESHKSSNLSILDIGAGNGSSLNSIKEKIDGKYGTYQNDYISSTLYAIEKSQVLINSMDKDLFIIGTDFYQQTFIDKKMDVYFSNPPYSDFKSWTMKLIRESNCNTMYLIIPERWNNSEEITSLLDQRRATYEILGNFSFEDSIYRKARAKVDIVKISFNISKFRNNRSYNSSVTVDPFELWFNENFHIQEKEPKEVIKEKKEERKNTLTNKAKIIDNLVTFYSEELDNLISNYKAVETLDSSLLEELNINIPSLKEGLKTKIQGLKNIYWKELFDNLEAITNRLTSKSRDLLLSTLLRNTSVDFTHENIYSIILWAIKNANKYIDSQLLNLYKDLTETKNIVGYKSNVHMVDDTWRSNSIRDTKDKAHHYKLDYRCVLEGFGGIHTGYSFEQVGNLSLRSHTVISDIFTIANNLGFTNKEDSRNREWESGKPQSFYTEDGELLAEIKAFKNGNMHYKLNQEFMKRFNIEAGKLNGWIKSPKEASEEMNINFDEAITYFNSNSYLLNSNIKLLS
ncbi:MAG: DUF4942 domain-containing protein [Candidatus Woesearchaeota archaeon]|jgi:hypothetical protein|nr:DUF4942 domain-containing protein [Candidatus Woesearchaeota archaeon]